MFGRGGGQGCAEKGKVKLLVQWGEMFLGARKGEVQDVGSEGCDVCGLDSSRCHKKMCFLMCLGPKKRGFTCIFTVFACLQVKSIFS